MSANAHAIISNYNVISFMFLELDHKWKRVVHVSKCPCSPPSPCHPSWRFDNSCSGISLAWAELNISGFL